MFRCQGLGTKELFLESKKRTSVVFVHHGTGHTSHQLLIGSLHLWGEFLAKVAGQHTHQHVAQELWEEIRGGHMGSRGIQLRVS